MSQQNIAFNVYHGPNLEVPYPAVRMRLNYQALFGQPDSVSAAEISALAPVLPEKFLDKLSKVDCYDEVLDFIAALAMSFQEIHAELGLAYATVPDDRHNSDILMGFVSEQGAKLALYAATEIALLVKGRKNREREELQQWLRKVIHGQQQLQPMANTAVMLRFARQVGIPHYFLRDAPRLFSLGQGRYSQLNMGSLSTRDSHIGQGLQQNKLFTNQTLKSMGYPCTTQYPAYDLGTLQRHAETIGFPVIVKPSSESKGLGITSDIRTVADLEPAFRLASQYSNGEVLVERFISGYDHRITVADGKVLQVVRKAPAEVQGDGRHSIRELIDRENRSRLEEKQWGGRVKEIRIDEPMHQLLRYENLTIDSVPAAGQRVVLRAVANLSTGGTARSVLNEMHPDNAEMVFSIARVFRLNCIGVDFITPDISRSWRECGQIVEVNAFPALSDETAETMLRGQFEADNFGRIPSALILSDNPESSRGKLQGKLYEELVTAYVDSATARLGAVERQFEDANLYARCVGLLIDPDCEAVVVVSPLNDLRSNGLPLAHFDTVYIETGGESPEELAPELRPGGNVHGLLTEHANKLVYI
jgi:cyanophycin synthetase